MNEVCVCAAIRLESGEIIRGHRHDSCFQTIAYRLGVKAERQGAIQGFMTTGNRFVSREEAMQLQKAAGLMSAQTGQPLRGDILFSEDLYCFGKEAQPMAAGDADARPPHPQIEENEEDKSQSR